MSDNRPAAAVPVVAPLRERFDRVERIAVLRGGGLGDLVFALPAMRALAAAYPRAEVVALGTPAHRALMAGRPGVPHRVEVLPIARGVRDVPGEIEDPAAIRAFLERMRGERFDLAVQVHGGGRFSNPFLLELGARHTAGLATDDAVRLERTVPYVYYQHEMLRALEAVGAVGAPPVELEPALVATLHERRATAALLSRVAPGDGPLVVVHPGATDPRRRWPAERFAEVAAALVARGCRVVVVGDDSDREAAAIVAGGGAVDLAGVLDLSGLVGVLAAAELAIADDSGPRHLAQALGARTASVFWFGNVINAGPLGRERHRVQLSFTTRCPVCGIDVTQVGWTAERCEHDPSFVAEVGVEAVLADALDLLAGPLAPRAPADGPAEP